VSNVSIENACEKTLFASPEAVASSVAYLDAKLSLLASSAALAAHDAGYRPAADRLRRGIEQDRFGIVAHVLTLRGCSSPDCADFALLRDTGRILANMKAHTFEAYVGAHSVAWNPGGVSVGALVPTPQTPAMPPSATMGVAAAMPSAPSAAAAPSPGRYEFPSASSIPPVSIMNPEPEGPPPAEAKPAAPAKKPPARRQTAHEPAAPAAPPTQIVPQQAAPPAQTSGSR
jgi:hypothetical protein